jgi:hypothetical protein
MTLRKVLLLIFVFSFSYLYANGRQEYPEIKIKIENRTNETVNFYFNRLYQPINLEPFNSGNRFWWETGRTPVNDVNQGYFALEYSNGVFELYTFQEEIRGMRPLRIDIDYTITITEDGVNFSPDTFREINYPSISRYMYDDGKAAGFYEGFYWEREGWDSFQSFVNSGNTVELVFTNNTDYRVGYQIYDIYYNNRYNSLDNTGIRSVQPHSEARYRTTDKLILLNQRMRITYYFDTNALPSRYRLIYLFFNSHPMTIGNPFFYNAYIPSEIQIILTESSHEIRYIDVN